MQAKYFGVTLAMLSFSAFGKVSFEEKLHRVKQLESLSAAQSLNVEAYRRELSYESQGLSLTSRAQIEANLLASKMRAQIVNAYEAELAEGSDVYLAQETVKKVILKDLELAAPELKDELKELALSTLEDLEKGSSNEVNLENTQKFLLKNVQLRSEYLNNEDGLETSSQSNTLDVGTPQNYKNKNDILKILVSEGTSGFPGGSSVDVRSNVMASRAADISLQIKMEFLGASIEGGPQISFKRDYATVAVVSGEGLTPFLLSNGNFDIWKRDTSGKILKKNGQEVRRGITFGCVADLKFSTNYSGGGGFKYMGAGASVKFSQTFMHSVNLSSRRIDLPDYVGDKSVTLKFLSDLCHNDFLNTKINNSMKVKDSLNIMMKNVVAGLVFSHPETKCAEDSHCNKWFNTEVTALGRINTVPRCRENREKIRSCVLRGLKQQNCAVYEKGKRTSDGLFEFECDTGLKCVKTKSSGWFQNYQIYEYARGNCQPVNSKDYVSPKVINIRFSN